MPINRKLQNRIGTEHITDEAEADIASQAVITAEQVEDFVGGMLDGTETFISVSYNDTAGNLNFVVPVKDEDNMSSNSATFLATQQSIKTYVDNEVAGIVDTAPAALNTLNELANALGDDANYATTTSSALGNRLRIDTDSQGLSGTQQINALTNLGITASKQEINILDGGLSTSDIPSLAASKITSGTFATARIADDAITASKLNVSGNGTSSQFLRSDGDGSFTWVVPNNTEYSVGDGGLTQRNFTTTLKNKLDGIAASANNYSLSSDLLDEDNMASNSATKAASQQSIKAYVDTEVAALVSSAPSALNTLNELAAALGDDANYASTTTTALGQKLVKSSNLSDLTNASTARSNLGLGSGAVLNTATISDGGTGLATADQIHTFVTGQGYTTDTQITTESVQDIVGAMLVGTETRIGVTYDDTNGRINFVVDDMTANTQLQLLDQDNMASNSATAAASQQSIKAYVDSQVANIVNSAPAALDTLNELAAALGDDASFSSTITTSIGTKLTKSNNLSDLTNVGTARTNLGLGTAATLSGTGAVANNNTGLVTGDVVYDYIAALPSGVASVETNDNIGVGDDVLDSLTTGNRNSALGRSAGGAITSGDHNVAVGYYSLNNGAVTGNHNIGIGSQTLNGTAAGGENIAIGRSAGQQVTGAKNILIGKSAGSGIQSGSNNVIIGNVDAASASTNDSLVIASGDGSPVWIKGSSDGTIDFPASKIKLNNSYGNDGQVLTSTGSGSAWETIPASGDLNAGGVNGSESAPTFSFASDSNNGLYLAASDQPAIAAGSLVVMQFGVLGGIHLMNNNRIRGGTGSAGNPTYGFIDDGRDNGMYKAATDTVAFSSAGSERLRLNSNGTIRFNDAFTFPSADGSANQVLKTDGSDTLTWVNPADLLTNSIDEAKLKVSNSPTNGYALTAQSGNTGGLTWAAISSGGASSLNELSDVLFSGTNMILGNPSSPSGSDNTGLGKHAVDGLTSGSYNTGFGRHALGAVTTGSYNTAVGWYAGSQNNQSEGITALGHSAGKAFTGGSSIFIGQRAGENTASGGSNVIIGYWSAQQTENLNSSTFVGSFAGYGDSSASNSGDSNVAIGASALRNFSTGQKNIAMGRNALYSLKTGSDNTAIGYSAGKDTTTASQNTIVGALAGENITTGGNNSLLGYQAGQAITDSTQNTIIGYNAGYNINGNSNTIMGFRAQYATVSTGIENVTIGMQAMRNATGSSNVAIGKDALYAVTGSNNVAVGKDAGKAITSAVKNTVVGYQAGDNITTGGYNVAIGTETAGITTGSYNIVIGAQTGGGITTGTGKIIIGNDGGSGTTNDNNREFLISNYDGTGRTRWLHGNSAGAITFNEAFTFPSADGSANQILKTNGSGTLSWSDAASGGASALNDLSDGIVSSNNTGLGTNALNSLSSGDKNTALGNNTATALTTGQENVAIGSWALDAATVTSNSVAIGHNSMGNVSGTTLNNNSGSYCVAIGHSTLNNSNVNNSVAIGYQAGTSLGAASVAIGRRAVYSAASAFTVAIGYSAGEASTSAAGGSVIIGAMAGYGAKSYGSVLIGYNAGKFAEGLNSIAIGEDALLGSSTNTTGNNNIAIGKAAGKVLTTGATNVSIGNYSGDAMTTATGNVMLGYKAGSGITTGYKNVYLGFESGEGTTTAGENVGIGDETLKSNTNGGGNTAVGHRALKATTEGYCNVAIGTDAMLANISGQRNTAVGGQDVLKSNTTGHLNIAIGYAAGNNITTGTGNVVIGRADVPSATANRQLSIGAGDDESTVWMTGNSSGVVDFPNGLTNNGTAMGAPVKQWKVPQGGYYWYGSQQDTYRVSSLPPFGVKNSIIQTIGTSTAYDKPIAFQFPSPKSGNLNLIEVYNQTAVSGLNLFIGIYSDYNGYPATLLGKVTIDMSSAGNRTSSTFTDASGSSATVTLVEDTPYHVVWVRDDSATQYQIYSANTQNAATSGISMGQSEGYIGMILAQVGGTDNVLPASYNSGSPTFNQFTVHNASIKPINVGIRFA